MAQDAVYANFARIRTAKRALFAIKLLIVEMVLTTKDHMASNRTRFRYQHH